MPRCLRPLTLLCALLTAAAPAAAGEKKGDVFFKKGDRIVFLGDSITML